MIIALFSSCEKCIKPKVEIYLLNKRIESKHGIDIKKVEEYSEMLRRMDTNTVKEFENLKVDTITNRLIVAGEFDAKKSDLSSIPLISDSEIVSFNKSNNELIIKSNASKKIFEIEDEFVTSTQFVISVDKKPVLTGYFNNLASSYSPNWNYITYINYNESIKNNGENKTFIIHKGVYVDSHNNKKELADLSQYQDLLNAFNCSGRLR